MIPDITITISGINELINANKRLIMYLENQTILEKMINNIVETAKKLAPIKTGDLIDSIKWKKTGGTYSITAIYYAKYLEFGTRYIPIGDTEVPRQIISGGGKAAYLPFIRPAIWQNINNIRNIMDDILNELYKR